jgi:MFS family permease
MLGYKRGTGDRSKRKKTIGFFTKPSVYHALIVIFLEFFAFGLLTAPMISVLNEAFPRHTFLMNGLIQGVKGFLSFLSAPFIGSLSDVFGRKPFLLLTVTLTCSPIPLMNVSHWWYFTMVTMSGIFAVTFSVVFAYVADITSEEDRSWTYGLVSATFAASLVTSPAIGAYLGKVYSENFVIALASAVALLDIFFILACVPESLPEKCRPGAWGTRIPWEKADPFRSLKRLSDDHLIMMLCIATFLISTRSWRIFMFFCIFTIGDGFLRGSSCIVHSCRGNHVMSSSDGFSQCIDHSFRSKAGDYCWIRF